MHSCAWMNRQYQQLGPSPQAATQLTNNTMRNQQAETANNSWQYRTPNTGDRPPQSAHFTFHDGAYSNRQTSNWQTSAVPHQAVFSQQPAGGKTNNYYTTLSNGNLQNSSTNMQSGNHGLQSTNGFQDAIQQDFHQNSMGNGKQSIMAQDGNVVSNRQHCRVQKSLFQNVSGVSTIPVSVYTTAATSLPHEQVVCTSTLVSAHNRQTAHNQNCRQKSTQHGFSPSILPPSYNTAVSLSLRKNSITANSSSGEQILHSMLQKTQQYSTQQNNGREATSSINSNSYRSQYETSLFLSKTNDPLLNPAADTGQQMSSRQMIIARIADDLRKSFIATSDGRPPVFTSSAYSGKHFVSKSNQNMQPVSTVTESNNSNASQSLALNSGQSLPKTTQSVMARTQLSVDTLPRQSSVPNVFHVTTTGDGSGSKAANAFIPKSNLVGSLSDSSQLMQLHETQSSVANNREMLEILEMLSSVKSNDSSILSSPGRTGARAVAVVQPLSQESYRAASKHTSSNTINQTGERTATNESLNNLEKLFISPAVAKNKNAQCLREGSNLYPENPNQMKSKKSSAASNDGTFLSSSDSAGHQDLSQKQLCADDTGSELAINMQEDQRVVLTAQQSVTAEVPVSQHGDKDKSENPTEPALSSVPTVPWTTVTLMKFLQDAEKAQMNRRRNFTNVDSSSKLLSMFWDGSCTSLAQKLKTGWYKDLITDTIQFCSKYVTPDTVILSQVKYGFGKQLRSYHVLEDNEVYLEPPYKSSWLNVNDQLDDIDTEFGFQWSLKHRLHVIESDSQPDQDGTGDSIPAQIISEVSNKVLSQTELEPLDSSEEKQASTVESTSTQTASPIKKESVRDPHYSFEIQVLPPEEAKVIFEQIQSKMPQSRDTDSQPERVMNSSVEGELPEVINVTLSDSKLKNESVCPIEQVCCIDRWMEIILGSSMPYLSKCQCKNKQSHTDFTDKTLDNERMPVQKKDKPCAIRSGSKFHSTAIGENQVKGGENVNNQIMTFSQTIDFTQDNDKPHSCSDKEPQNISKISIDNSQSSIILISENEDEDLFSSENEIPNQMPDFEKDSEHAQMKLTESSQSSCSDSSEKETKQLSRSDTEIQSDPEVDCVQDQLKSTGSTLSCTSVSSDKEIENLSNSESKVARQMSELEENCGQAQLTSTSVPKSSLESEEEQTQISATPALQTTFSLSGKHETVKRKQKTLSSYDGFSPFLKKSKKCKPPVVDSQPALEGISKCRKVFVDATDSEPLASNVRTVELVLFGSAPQDKCALIGGRKRHISSPVSDGVPRPPEVLTVNLSPLRRKSSETVPAGEYSIKRVIYEKWRRGFPPTKIRCRSKLKTQKCTFASLSGVNLRKAEIGPTNTEELPVSSETRIWNRNSKRCLSLKRRRSLSNGLKPGGEKMRKDMVSLKHPADQERSNAENGSHAVMPLQQNDVLRFSVLPNTFNFKDGSNGRKEPNDPVPDKPDLFEGKNESHNKTAIRAKGTWCLKPEKYHPLLSSPAPKTSSLFLEFQKKYKEMIQQPMAE
ncbi:uncharacterized protein si:ch211-106e7.2 [Siniperca chuatsi]|uniref:uncharacterized protein si:ch211-106e7.2 n=1 Tax=Siniperca chuatsi TaxID=119488 RepID=UPI001CE1EEB3|nr:uncharacterized protein si:ch211-106e7.2 [Siniperca chuatsi]